MSFEISNANYWHKPLNVKKLLSVQFLDSPLEVSIGEMRPNTRNLEEKDIERCFEIYQEEIKKYKIFDNMDKEDFCYFIKNKIMKVFVAEENNEIVSFGSFYILDTMAIKKNIKISGAYLSIVCGQNYKDMVNDLISASYKEKCDVFNGINIGNNEEVFDSLEFLKGTGELKYYLYNWKIGKINKKDIFYYMH